MHKALKPFRCSFDGVNIRELAAGEEHDFGSLATGLAAAGYITEVVGEAGPVIPADWRSLHHLKIIALAKQFDPSVTKKDDAIALLETLSAGGQG